MKEKKSHSTKTGKLFYHSVIVLCSIVAIGSAVYLLSYYLKAAHTQRETENIKSLIMGDGSERTVSDDGEKLTATEEVDGQQISAKFARLYHENPDFVGWLQIEDTRIDYPVMQTKQDEVFYIHRDFYKNYDENGTLFLGADSEMNPQSDNCIIYGHNMKSGIMFAGLMKYAKEDYYKSHPVIQFDTIYGNGVYDIVAAFYGTVYAEDDKEHFKYYAMNQASSRDEFDLYWKQIHSMSLYDTGIDVEYGDKLLTLSTCTNIDDNGRFVVVAKKRE